MTERSVKVRLSADVAEGVRNVRQFGAETKKSMGEAEKATASSSRALDDLGSTAGRVGLAAATGLGLATKAAMDWESDWAGVTKTVDGTAAQMAVLEDELRGLATTLPATHSEIAGVAEAAGQLGVAREDITDFTRTMVDLGETTNLTAEDAATSIAQMSNVMRTAPEDVDNLGAALVALGNDGASTERQIIEMAQRMAGAGAQIGLAESDLLAIANAAASMGIEVEAGGTAVSRVFTDMAKATAQGGEKLDLFARTAGMSAREFAAAFESDPARAFAAFTQGLDRINKSGGDVFTTLDQLSLSDVRVSQALLGMAASGDLLTDSLDLGAQAWEENTALALEAAKRYDTSAAQVQIAWNNIKDAAIEFGEVALPVVEGVAGAVSGLAQTVGDLPAPVKSVTMSLLGITAVLGSGLWFGTKVVGAVNSTKDSLQTLGLIGDKTAGSLDGVAVSGGKAQKAMRGLGAAAVVLAGLSIGDSLQRQVDETLPGMEELTRQLIELAQSGSAAALSSEFDSLGSSIERLTDRNWAQKLQDSIYSKAGFLGSDSAVDEAKAEIEALDAALANLVTAGNAEMAAAVLDNLVASGKLSADELASMRPLLEGYDEALAGAENAATLAAEGTDEFADSTRGAAEEAMSFAAALETATEEMRDAREEALRAANAELNYEEALLDVRDAANENTGVLQRNGDAKRGMAREAIEAKRELFGLADAWNNQSDAAKNVPGAYRGAIRAFVDAATQMGYGREEARLLAKEILEIPNRKVRVEADTSDARASIFALNALVDSVDTHRVIQFRVQTIGQVPATFTGSQTYRATGGPIPGRSPHKRADNIPIMATAGEYMHQVDAVDYYGLGVMDAINQRRIPRTALQGYADGGLIGGRPGLAAGGSVEQRIELLRLQQQINELRKDLNATGKDSIKGLNRQIAALELRQTQAELRAARNAPLREFRQGMREARAGFDIEPGMTRPEVRTEIADLRRGIREAGGEWTRRMRRQADVLIEVTGRYQKQARLLEKQEQALDDAREALQELRVQAASYGQTVAGTFDNNIFGEGLAGLQVRLEADTNDLAASITAWEQAAAKGLDGPLAEALYASGDVGTAQQLAGLTPAQIDAYEQMFAARAEKQAQASAFAQEQIFAPRLQQAQETVRENTALVRDTREVMKNLSNRMENLEQRLENGVARGAAQGVKDGMTGRSRQQGAKARARG
ncbi:phage tail tape measure protein [Nocardioides pakistanensis]